MVNDTEWRINTGPNMHFRGLHFNVHLNSMSTSLFHAGHCVRYCKLKVISEEHLIKIQNTFTYMFFFTAYLKSLR